MRHRLLAAPVCAVAACWVLSSGVAAADPAPVPPDPALIGPAGGAEGAPPAPVDPFTALSQQTKSDPGAALAQMFLGGASGTGMGAAAIGLSAPSPVDPLAGAILLTPKNYRMPSGDNPSPYALDSGVPPGPFARVDGWKGVHAMVHGGLGRMPGGELGAPLSGTAPAPGINIPAGLEQFYVPPAAPGAPVVPGDVAPPAPLFPPAG